MSGRDALSPNWAMVVTTSACLREYYQFQEPADQTSKEIPPHVPIRQQMNLKENTMVSIMKNMSNKYGIICMYVCLSV